MELWRDWGFEFNFTWCGVGSREIPAGLAPYLEWVGECMALLGGVLCTGDAIGADYHFMVGYNRGRSDKMPPAQIYYTAKKNQRNLTHNPKLGHHEFERYYEVTHLAQEAAYEARGSFEGLFPSGVALHSRNALQVLSETMTNPRWVTLFAAKPVGKQGKVSGGTNTAVQISRKNKIHTVNLWEERQRIQMTTWLHTQFVRRNLTIPELRSTHAA